MKYSAFLLLLLPLGAVAQIGIGTNTVNQTARLQVDADASTNSKGFLAPRVELSATNNNAPFSVAPATGLLVYNTATAGSGSNSVTPGFYYYDGVRWQRIINTPDAIVNFDTADPNTGSPNFTDGPAASSNYIYVSSVDNSQWTWNGTAYVTYVPPASTAWYTAGGTTDAGSSKTASIYRSGNVGIGTSSPTSRLNIAGGGIKLHNGFPNNSARPALTTTAIGNYEIRGVGSITGTSQEDGGDDGFLRLSAGGGTNVNTQSSIDLSGFSSGNPDMFSNIVMRTGGIERLRIREDGFVGIGTTNPLYRLDVSGDINASGSVRANTVALTSDARLKNVLQSWDTDDQIDFVQFRWKNSTDNRDHFGYLAQEVQKVLPDAVYTDNAGMMAVNYDEVQSYKIALQEQRIKELERITKNQQQTIQEFQQSIEDLKKMIKRKRSLR